jgi:hypothetical protein
MFQIHFHAKRAATSQWVYFAGQLRLPQAKSRLGPAGGWRLLVAEPPYMVPASRSAITRVNSWAGSFMANDSSGCGKWLLVLLIDLIIGILIAVAIEII